MSGLGSFSAGGLGMGLAFTLEDKFTETANEIERSLTGLDGTTDRVSRSINKSLALVGAGIASLGVGFKTLSFFKQASDIRAEFQQYDVMFETLLGSAEKAIAFTNMIKQDAKDNPIFGTKSLVVANSALLSTGRISEDASRKMVNNLSEIMAGVGKGDEELQRMAANLNQIASLGKASAMDIKQFVFAGVPIFKLLEDATGYTMEQLKDMDITIDMLDKTFEHATSQAGMFYKATERAASSTKGLKAALEDNIELTMEKIGATLEPITRGLYARLISITDAIYDMLNTPLGSKLVRITALIGGLLVVGGALLLMIAATRMSVFFMAGAFKESARAKILDALATKGLSAALRQMGVAAWASLGPYALIAVAIMAVVYAVYKLYKAMTEGDSSVVETATKWGAVFFPLPTLIFGIIRGFNELKKPLDELPRTGALGFFVKLAGVIQGVWEIFRSWNGESAEMSEDLYNKLDSLGVLPLVESIGRGVIRLKQFFLGIQEGLSDLTDWFSNLGKEIWDDLSGMFDLVSGAFSDLWNTIKTSFEPIATVFEELWDMLFGTEESLITWKLIGEAVGASIGFIIKTIATILRVIIEIIAGIITVVVVLVTKIVEGFVWIVGAIWDGIVAVGEFFSWLWDLGKQAVNWAKTVGKGILTGIWDGIKGMWGSLVDWVMEKARSLADAITKPFKKAWSGIKSFFGFGGNDDSSEPNGEPVNKPTTPLTPSSTPAMFHNNTYKVQNVGMYQAPDLTNYNQNPIIVQNIMDGEVISERVIERTELTKSRE